jgi:hypothetical protein
MTTFYIRPPSTIAGVEIVDDVGGPPTWRVR